MTLLTLHNAAVDQLLEMERLTVKAILADPDTWMLRVEARNKIPRAVWDRARELLAHDEEYQNLCTALSAISALYHEEGGSYA